MDSGGQRKMLKPIENRRGNDRADNHDLGGGGGSDGGRLRKGEAYQGGTDLKTSGV